jgi:hypothetical protein
MPFGSPFGKTTTSGGSSPRGNRLADALRHHRDSVDAAAAAVQPVQHRKPPARLHRIGRRQPDVHADRATHRGAVEHAELDVGRDDLGGDPLRAGAGNHAEQRDECQ